MAVTPLTWSTSALSAQLEIADEEPVRFTRIVGGSAVLECSHQPLVEVVVAGYGRARSSLNYTRTAVGARLRYASHEVDVQSDWSTLRVVQQDAVTGLVATSHVRAAGGVPGFQAWTTLTNESHAPLRIEAVSSLTLGLLPAGLRGVAGLRLTSARSTWVAEGRWCTVPLRDEGAADIDVATHRQVARGRVSRTSSSTWSTGEHLPVGVLEDDGLSVGWQVEHDGPWHWEVVDTGDGVSIGLFGPTDVEHGWSVELEPGQSFTTVPASLVVADRPTAAFASLTDHRRALRGTPHDEPLPVVFNDYMNTLMADPTTAKLLPLIDAAAQVGAEYFCIDAGWYDDDGDWWDSVGEWEPSTTRFDGGLTRVVDHIRHAGMVPGLWLEPEVVGVRSPMAARLPDEAFLRRGGHRVVEHRRHQLDFSHPAARKHLDEVVDRLVETFGVGFFKLDYNITPGLGTDGADSLGAGLLAHNRAYLDWLDGVRERHPALVIENCASGGMRADYALLSRLHLQSTSDQQNPLLYPPIAAAAPASVLPEQAANWAYPQPGMSDEEIAFTVCTGLAGRPYLSGRVDLLDEDQRELVRAGVGVHQAIRPSLARTHAVWPLGLPEWEDPWVCLGLAAAGAVHVVVWRRPGAPDEVLLPFDSLRDRDVSVEVVYPTVLPGWSAAWDASDAALHVISRVEPPTARVLRLTVRD